jgi:hypothetical protein
MNLFALVSISDLIEKDLLLKAILFGKVRFLSGCPSKFAKSRTYSGIVWPKTETSPRPQHFPTQNSLRHPLVQWQQ